MINSVIEVIPKVTVFITFKYVILYFNCLLILYQSKAKEKFSIGERSKKFQIEEGTHVHNCMYVSMIIIKFKI